MTEFLTVEDLHRIAHEVVGPDVLVRDHGLLQSAVGRCQATVFGEDAYPGVDGKTAALLASLVGNHALIDGNKRLGWAAAVAFCGINDVLLEAPFEDAAYDLVINIATHRLVAVEDIAAAMKDWFSSQA